MPAYKVSNRRTLDSIPHVLHVANFRLRADSITMTDYSKWKVTDLKAELKRRGIAQTGLRVKQNFIDKLVEDDAKTQSEAVGTDSVVTQDAPKEEVQPVEPEQQAQPTPEVAAQSQDRKPEESLQEQQQHPEAQGDTGETHLDQKPVKSTQDVGETSEQPPQQSAEDAPVAQPDSGGNDLDKTLPADTGGDLSSTAAVAQPKSEIEASAQPVEQAPGSAEAQQSKGAEEDDTQPPESAETAAPAVPQNLEPSTGLSTPLAPEEVIEDRRKRKRRSQSPVPTPEAIASKKAKSQNETPEVILAEDRDSMNGDRDVRPELAPPGSQEEFASRAKVESDNKVPAHDETNNAPISEDSKTNKGAPEKQDVRFKGLFAPTEWEQARPASPPADTVMEEAATEPAKHVATPALYMDGLMRPLQHNALRSHLISLAAPPGGSPNPEVITEFYLDSIKTHCFVGFVDVAAASRVRAALHGTVWPHERNRKTLFVDFVPENKLQEWINMEEGSRRRGGPPPRWGIKYDQTDDGVEAILEEIDSRAAASQPSRGREQGDFARPPPLGPRAEMGDPNRRPSGPRPVGTRTQSGQGFKPLDELFMSTTTKPKLYYLPVPRSVADRRLDRFDDLLRKGPYPRRGGDEPRRITFEDGDLFVDHGPEFGMSNRGRGGGRGRGRGRGFQEPWRDNGRGRY
ncbi:hypothetical protein EYZ11_004792 [Aspergillus tanneri]|uniref:SAP domain-containing protein n=1 Tax=Aspergillus tanneri TaxID=1220188 RepID=A0A4V3UPM2_9EURO|nr:hypothetical protein EYZ11_004792 [Aspergillus tanneri]